MYIFIDESGDLGFDFTKSGTSKSFTIALLICESEQSLKAVKHAVLKTLKRKINYSKKKSHIHELKGSNTSIATKKYFLNQMPASGWSLYAITVNKEKVYPPLQSNPEKNKFYNFVTKTLLETLISSYDLMYISIIIDSSKNSADRKEFNDYIKMHLDTTFNWGTQAYITHENSINNAGIQAVDMFCWGIQQKETTGNDEWLKLYQLKIVRHVKLF